MYFSPLQVGQSVVVLYTGSSLLDPVCKSTVLTIPCGLPVIVSAQVSQGVSCFRIGSARLGFFIIGLNCFNYIIFLFEYSFINLSFVWF